MSTSSDHTAYAQRYIAFIDVLGFGSLVSESGRDQVIGAQTIKRVSDAILWSIDELEEKLDPLSGLTFTQFSDSFVVSVDASQPSRHALVSFAFSILEVVDCFLASRLLLRGGISRGLLIH